MFVENSESLPLHYLHKGGGGGLVAKSCLTLVTLWTVARQAPLSMGFSRQEYWSGLPFSSPGDLPNSGIKPEPTEPPGKQLVSTAWKHVLFLKHLRVSLTIMLFLNNGVCVY